MTLRSEHARRRIDAAAALMHDLWGDGLPPGPAPWQRIAADVLDVDDGLGAQQGLTVQGDELALSVLAEALTYVPVGASLRSLIPQSLLERMELAAAVRDPDARGLAVGSRLLSVAIRLSGARWAGTYLPDGDHAALAASLGLTPWERAERSRLYLPGDGPLCRALLKGLTSRGELPVPVAGDGWAGEPELEAAPCVAVPFPSTGLGSPADGALLLVWPADGDPDPDLVGRQVRPLAAEAEHLHTALL